MHQSVGIVDYGMGNISSLQNAISELGWLSNVISEPSELLSHQKIILPGVGAFCDAMKSIRDRGFLAPLNTFYNSGRDVLGICLGMQFLMDSSEEFGETEGLGLINGKVIPIPPKSTNGDTLIVPHIGWSALEISGDKDSWDNSILNNTPVKSHVYFVHSFFSKPNNKEHLLAHCNYGGNNLSAVICRDNVMGCQFHPEKSGAIGLNILRAFLTL